MKTGTDCLCECRDGGYVKPVARSRDIVRQRLALLGDDHHLLLNIFRVPPRRAIRAAPSQDR